MKKGVDIALWVGGAIILIGGGVAVYFILKPREGDQKKDKDGNILTYHKGSGWVGANASIPGDTTSSNTTYTPITPKPVSTKPKQNADDMTGILAPAEGLYLYTGTPATTVYGELSPGVANMSDTRGFNKKDQYIGVISTIYSNSLAGIKYIRVDINGTYYLVNYNGVYAKRT